MEVWNMGPLDVATEAALWAWRDQRSSNEDAPVPGEQWNTDSSASLDRIDNGQSCEEEGIWPPGGRMTVRLVLQGTAGWWQRPLWEGRQLQPEAINHGRRGIPLRCGVLTCQGPAVSVCRYAPQRCAAKRCQ